MEKKVLNDMFGSLLHIGNKTNYWNSRMRDYIYGSVNGIHVINLVKTAKKLEEVKEELKNLATDGKKILFVATKLQARDSFERLATDTGNYFVTEKWVPGLLTNFKTIKRRISTYLKLKRDYESGAFDVLTKKEKASKKLELDKLHRSYRGVKDMKRIPEVMVVVDGIYEKQSIKEANNLKLQVFAVFNTNGDDSKVSNMIPANTNSVKSLEYIANSLLDTLKTVVVKPRKTGATIKKMTPVKRPPLKKAPVKKTTDTKVVKEDTKKVEEKKETTAKKVEKKEAPKTEK